MSLRVVLMAEGGAETTGEMTLPPAPGTPLTEKLLGPAHILIRRCLVRVREVETSEIAFEQPNRTRGGRLARGSDLLHRTRLRQLLSWARPGTRPDVALVLVDADGRTDRRTLLGAHTEGLLSQPVVGVAIQEFEAWLVADIELVVKKLPGATVPSSPEEASPGVVKGTLVEATSGLSREAQRNLRCELAADCDLETVEKRCRAFKQLLRDLRAPKS